MPATWQRNDWTCDPFNLVLMPIVNRGDRHIAVCMWPPTDRRCGLARITVGVMHINRGRARKIVYMHGAPIPSGQQNRMLMRLALRFLTRAIDDSKNVLIHLLPPFPLALPADYAEPS